MSRRRDDPIEDRKLTLMRQADAASRNRFSASGREKEGKYRPRTPSLPKGPWDDKKEPEDK